MTHEAMPQTFSVLQHVMGESLNNGEPDAIRAPELRALPDARASADPVESAFEYTLQEQWLGSEDRA